MNSAKPLPSSNNAKLRIGYEQKMLEFNLQSLSIDYLAAT